jgi:hypothetical protein
MRPPHFTLAVSLLAVGCEDPGVPRDLGDWRRPDLAAMARRDLSAVAPPGWDLSGFEPTSPDLSMPCPVDLAAFDLIVAPHAPGEAAPSFAPMVKGPGAVVTAMQAWTVVWQGDESLGASVNQFLNWMLTSDYWRLLSQYGVGAGAARGVVVLAPSVAPEDGSAVDAALASGYIPSPDGNTALFIVPPAGTSLAPIPAYHSFYSVPYAVVDQQADQGPLSFDQITFYLSHEAAELATDPRLTASLGWYLPPGLTSHEIGDLCRSSPSLLVVSGADAGPSAYSVTRLYSNAAVASGVSYPCAPSPDPLFGLVVDSHPLLAAPFVGPWCSVAPEAIVRLMPFSAFGDLSLHWQAQPNDTHCQLTPSNGDAQPGIDFFVTVWSNEVDQCAFSGSVSAPSHPGYRLPFGFSTSFQ